MAPMVENNTLFPLPPLPTETIQDFLPYVCKHGDTSIGELVKPFKTFEHELRKLYAQQPQHPYAQDGFAALVPLYDGHEDKLRIQARNLSQETEYQKSKYLLALQEHDRRPSGSPAMVHSLREFQNNFSIFSEASLADLDWNNVVCAGSAVTTSLVPVPPQHAMSKKGMRAWYHEQFAPASDVDLFLYGLTPAEAVKKIIQIERAVKDSLLVEATTIRTKYAITIVSQYPTRHVQVSFLALDE